VVSDAQAALKVDVHFLLQGAKGAGDVDNCFGRELFGHARLQAAKNERQHLFVEATQSDEAVGGDCDLRMKACC
jgi:hypothetical protein